MSNTETSILAVIIFTFSFSSWAMPKRAGAFISEDERPDKKMHLDLHSPSLSSFEDDEELSSSLINNEDEILSREDGAGSLQVTPEELRSEIFTYLSLNDQAKMLRILGTREFISKSQLTLQHHYNVSSAAVSPDGKKVLTRSHSHKVQIWDAETGILLHTLEDQKHFIGSACFSPDGSRVLTTSWDHPAKLWDVETGVCLRTLKGSANISTSPFSSDGLRVLTRTHNKRVYIWNVATGRVLHTLIGHTGRITLSIFSPDNSKVLTQSWDQTVKLWDASTGTLLRTFQGVNATVSSAFSPDGLRVLIGSTADDQTVELRDVESGLILHTLRGHEEKISRYLFSPDSSKLLTEDIGGSIKFWRVETGLVLSATLTGFIGGFSPDGKKMVIISKNQEKAQLRDVETTQLLHTFHDSGLIRSRLLSFSPDGSKVLTASYDHSAKIWDLRNGALLRTLRGHTAEIYYSIFFPNGLKVLTTGYSDKTARIWHLCLLKTENID